MKMKFIFFAYLLFITVICLSQTDTTHYWCNNCTNHLFDKSELIKTNKKYIFIKYNKTNNKNRANNNTKDVHCAYCNNHIGYCQKEGEVEILPKSIDKKKDTYICANCKKPLLKATDLKSKNKTFYYFTVQNNQAIEIANRSFVINNKHIYCSFCYEFVGIQKRNGNLKLKKDKVH